MVEELPSNRTTALLKVVIAVSLDLFRSTRCVLQLCNISDFAQRTSCLAVHDEFGSRFLLYIPYFKNILNSLEHSLIQRIGI